MFRSLFMISLCDRPRVGATNPGVVSYTSNLTFSTTYPLRFLRPSPERHAGIWICRKDGLRFDSGPVGRYLTNGAEL